MKTKTISDSPRLGQILEKLTTDEKAWLNTALFRDPLNPVYRPGIFLYLAALIVVLLWPFDMFYDPSASRNLPFWDLPFGLISLSPLYLRDFFANIAIFVPFGFLLSGLLFGQKSFKSAGNWVTIAVGFAFSLSVELLQFGSPIRHSSMIDVATNTFGTIIGNLAHIGYLMLIKRSIADVAEKW